MYISNELIVMLQVWEVTAQLIGLALSVGVLRSIETARLPGMLPCL